MLDLNHILLFIAIVSPLVLLARTRRALGLHRTWRMAAFAVLVVAGGTWIIAPRSAGFVGGGAWFFLLLVPAVGLRRLREWIARRRYRAARTLAGLLRIVHPSSELRELRDALELRSRANATDAAYAEAMLQSWSQAHQPARRAKRFTPAVGTFIVLNAAMFAAEFALGGTTNPDTLHLLGALELYPVLVQHEYWRLVTALFLHFGPLHLAFNLYALLILGPPLEQAIGSTRFAICYMLAGIGSTAGVLLLRFVAFTRGDQLVGASGCVMGIIGAWAGLLVRHWRAPLATRRLQNILLVVVVQIMFDLSTPQVSMAAHLCGVATGFVVGLAVAPRRLPV